MSSPDADTILPKIAVIEREIAGIVRVYNNPPNSISMADMPCFINLPGPMSVDWQSAGEDELYIEGIESRQYDCLLVVAALGSGVSGEPYGKIVPFLAKVRDKFASYPFLKGEPVYQAQLQGDTGIRTDIMYGGTQYAGVRFTVVVAGRVKVKYAE